MNSWFTSIKRQGISPEFVHLDKDFGEISAVDQVWPKAKAALCLWHVLNAIKRRLQAIKNQKRTIYFPFDTRDIIPDLDVTWTPVSHNSEHQRRSGQTFDGRTTQILSSLKESTSPSSPPPVRAKPDAPTVILLSKSFTTAIRTKDSELAKKIEAKLAASEEIGSEVNVEDVLGIGGAIAEDVDGEDEEEDWRKPEWEVPKTYRTGRKQVDKGTTKVRRHTLWLH